MAPVSGPGGVGQGIPEPSEPVSEGGKEAMLFTLLMAFLVTVLTNNFTFSSP